MTRVLWLAFFLLLAVEFPWEREAEPLPVTEDVCSEAGGTDACHCRTDPEACRVADPALYDYVWGTP